VAFQGLENFQPLEFFWRDFPVHPSGVPPYWTDPVSGGIPGMIPSPMQWIDDGTIITNLPVWKQPQRFYRLVEP